MNLRLACDICGSQPCVCFDEECRACDGEGKVEDFPSLEVQYGGPYVAKYKPCGECDGEGWIKCNRGGDNCPFEHCYCEAAWERQQEDMASEPPMSADERHQLAWQQKQDLRS